MKISKRQLRRIIKEELVKEEYGMGKDIEEDMLSLLSYLQGAVDRAEYIRTASNADVAYAERAGGREADDLAMMLEEIWVGMGFDPGQIFK